MKKLTFIACLITCIFFSCQKDTHAPTTSSLAAKYTNLTLNDPFDLPNPATSEQLAISLFELKEDGNGLTEAELLSLGNPANNEDLLYALLFVEKYDRSGILWSWDEPTEDVGEDEIEDRSHTAKWRWTGDAPIASMWCSGHQKWPAQQVKNRFQDPCGEVNESGRVYQCCYSLCNADLPTDCQDGCTNPTITLPAGSVDALQQAVDAVCTNGTIILAAGEHTENSGVVINKRLTIKGENGAVLKIHSEPYTDFSLPISVALHFMVDKARLENLTVEALNAPGGVGVLLQDSDKAKVSDCHFNGFQYTILIEESDKVVITDNVIVNSDAWLSGAIADALGIAVINGEKAEIRGNEVSFGLFGIWPCDKDGICEGNYTHHNYIGLILCRVPAGSFILPNGTPTGAEFSATRWKVRNNRSTDNFDAGYMVIDGANNNSLNNNAAGNNATYDFDLVGDSYRFGFLTPTCFNNTVNLGSYSGLTVKDCGESNLILGNAVVVDTSDPGNECF